MKIRSDKSWYDQEHNIIIPNNRQFFLFTVGERGSGKSQEQELFLSLLHEQGHTCLDLWCAGLESMFYCINRNCKESRKNKVEMTETELRQAVQQNNIEDIVKLKEKLEDVKFGLGCKCFKRYPVTVLCHESVEFDQATIDNFNGKFYTKAEWIAKCRKNGETIITYDRTNPPEKPPSQQKEWLKIVKIPSPNRGKDDGTLTAQNKIVLETFTDALLESRQERRILCFVPKLFPREFHRFKTIEIIVSHLEDISDTHFKPFTEDELGRSQEQWTKYERNHHRLVMLMRELGEIAPEGMYTDKSAGMAKRKIMKLVRTGRHAKVSMLCDAQRSEDVSKNVRTQTNAIVLKRISDKLLGDELKWVRDWIAKKHEAMFSKYGYSDEVRDFIYDKFPPLNKLNKNRCYVLYNDDYLKLWDIPTTKHHHKQEDDDFYKITGITYSINQELLKSPSEKKTEENTEVDNSEEILFNYLYPKRYPKNGTAIGWNALYEQTVDDQKNGKLDIKKDLTSMKASSLQKWFKRMEKRLHSPTQTA